jgi:hypothetical protein
LLLRRMDLLNCVIGLRGPAAPLELCNGLMVPVLFFEQIYASDRASLIASIPSPAKRAEAFEASAEELLRESSR